LSLSGSVLGNYPLRISPSKSAIQNTTTRSNYSQEQLDQITRTIHIASLDIGVNEAYLKDIFERASGPVARIALAGETSYATRFAFVEFYSRESAQDALKMNGVLIAGKPIRITMSRSPIMYSNAMDRYSQQDRYGYDNYQQQPYSYAPSEWNSPPREVPPPEPHYGYRLSAGHHHRDEVHHREEPPVVVSINFY
jgi:RNA recognition motif-containing protein